MLFSYFQDGSGTEVRIKALSAQVLRLVYEYVCRSLFKADRMMFAMHMVHGYRPDLFEENVSLYLNFIYNTFTVLPDGNVFDFYP